MHGVDAIFDLLFRKPRPQAVAEAPRAAIKLVALDVDGTLLSSQKKLTPRVIRTIERVATRGVRLVLASARPPRGLITLHQQLGLDTHLVSYNGALIIEPGSHHVLEHRPLPPALVQQIIEVVRGIEPTTWFGLDNLDAWREVPVPAVVSAAQSPADAVPQLDLGMGVAAPPAEFVDQPATRLLFQTTAERRADVATALAERFAGRINAAITDNHVVQVQHAQADKAHALARLARHYHVPRQSVMAIGDARNDLGMLRWAGLSLAMENAPPRVRKAAHAVIPSNDDHGVAHALEQYILEA